jgi:hypothetical protein
MQDHCGIRAADRAVLGGRSTWALGVVKNGRVLVALAVTPLVPALVIGGANASSGGYNGPLDLLLGAFLVYVFAGQVTVVVGLPMFLVLRRFNLLHWWSALSAGAFAGYLTALVFGINTFVAPILHGFLPFVVIGAISGLVFFVTYSHRPPRRLTFVGADRERR